MLAIAQWQGLRQSDTSGGQHQQEVDLAHGSLRSDQSWLSARSAQLFATCEIAEPWWTIIASVDRTFCQAGGASYFGTRAEHVPSHVKQVIAQIDRISLHRVQPP